ncbi:hypothetical protein ACFVW2_41665 [Streptomyces sp. NPDC058171]|uniref:hypothetical protein n=1 Tax=Rhodococcus koreensis TaxID=99653 RepID=UPI0036DD0510
MSAVGLVSVMRLAEARRPRQSGRDHSVEFPSTADASGQPTDFWLSALTEATPIAELVWRAKIRWRIELDYREVKPGSVSLF